MFTALNIVCYVYTGLVSSPSRRHTLFYGLQLRVDVLRRLTFAHSTRCGKIFADYKSLEKRDKMREAQFSLVICVTDAFKHNHVINIRKKDNTVEICLSHYIDILARFH